MKHKWSLLVFAAATAIAVAAETLTVQREAPLRGTPNNYAKAIASLPKGATLNVLEKDKTFAKVDYNGTVGWVRLQDLEARKNVGTNASAAGEVTASGNASEVGAGKGLGDRAESYGKATGGDARKIDTLILLRKKQIDSGAWSTWAAEGKVGADGKGGN